MNDQQHMTARYEGLESGETPAIRDAIAGLTGTLGIEVYAWQRDAQQAVQYAEFHTASATREQEGAVAAGAAQGEG